LRTASNSIRRARPLLGTFVEITVAGAMRSTMDAALEAAFDAVAEVHHLMSFHVPGSDVARLNDGAWIDPVRVHAWTFRVLEAAIDLHRCSAGAFDVAVAPILQEKGLLPPLRQQRPCLARDPVTTASIHLLPGHCVKFEHPDTRIDLGGIAKGFAVDRAIDVLREHGISAGLVNAGGDLSAFGPNPNLVHIRDPRDPSCVLCAIGPHNEALASTGSGFDPFLSRRATTAAVIDPRSRKSVRGVLGATVRAPCCMLADALTKVVMLAGLSAVHLLDSHRAGALLVLADGGVRMTADVAGAIRLAA
jgi:thiamine biosynthesis lipoprotein